MKSILVLLMGLLFFSPLKAEETPADQFADVVITVMDNFKKVYNNIEFKLTLNDEEQTLNVEMKTYDSRQYSDKWLIVTFDMEDLKKVIAKKGYKGLMFTMYTKLLEEMKRFDMHNVYPIKDRHRFRYHPI